MKIDNECVVSVFPRWKHVVCFYYGFSSDPYDFFSWLCLTILVSRNAIGMYSLIGRGEDDLRLGCKAQLLAFLVLFLYIFLNYMCHLISFVGLVLAIVRGVAPVSTIELARKEKKVLACMCRFRSSSVVLSLDLILELRHS